MAVILLVAVLMVTVSGQSLHIGKCPTPPVQQEFNVEKYLGMWYEIARLPAVFERGRCQQATYSLLKEGDIKVVNAELLPNGKLSSIEGKATIKDVTQPAILEVTFFNDVPSPYWVVSTDYTSYAVVYSCVSYLGLFHIDFAWILARSRSLNSDTVSKLRADLGSYGVNLSKMFLSDQANC